MILSSKNPTTPIHTGQIPMQMSYIYLPRPADDEVVAVYLGGSRLFPKLIKPDSDFDTFTILGKYYEGWLATLNLGFTDRYLLDLWIPESFFSQTSPHWQALVAHREKLLTRPRLTRLTKALIVRLERTQLGGKLLAELLKRTQQVLHLIHGKDPYELSDAFLDLLVRLRADSTADETGRKKLKELTTELINLDLTIFPEEEVEVRLV